MGKLITGIEGAINAAVGKAKENADNPALHVEGTAQKEQGLKQQDQARAPASDTIADKG